MSDRLIRVNQLLRQALSELLRTKYREESVYITLHQIDVSPDLRHAKVFFSVVGPEEQIAKAKRFFKQRGNAIRSVLGKEVRLKYTPDLRFIYDDSMARGMELNDYMDALGLEGDVAPDYFDEDEA